MKYTLIAPVLLVVLLFTYIFLDMARVSHAAQNCEPIVEGIEEYRNKNNAYPVSLADLVGVKDSTKCMYSKHDESFIITYPSGFLNLQVYEYDSRNKSWASD